LPPRNCNWSKHADAKSLKFQRFGKFSWFSFIGLLFANLFWNGIVLAAIIGLLVDPDRVRSHDDWWLSFVLLIPFELGRLTAWSCRSAIRGNFPGGT